MIIRKDKPANKDPKELVREKYDIASKIIGMLKDALAESLDANTAKSMEQITTNISKHFNKPDSEEPPTKKVKLSEITMISYTDVLEKAFSMLHPTIDPDKQMIWPKKIEIAS